MKIYCKRKMIELEENINSLIELKNYIKQKIYEIMNLEIFIVQIVKQSNKDNEDEYTLVEEHNFNTIVQDCNTLYCYPICDFIDIIFKKMKNDEERKSQIIYQQEQQKLKESQRQIFEVTSQIKPKNIGQAENNTNNDITLQFQTSQIRTPKSQSLEMDEREYFLSRNFQTSFIATMKSRCEHCTIVSKSDFINLSCFHFYHKECLTEYIKSQITSKKTLISCGCGKTIRKINYQFLSLNIDEELQNLYYNNQALKLKLQYSFLKCCCTCRFIIVCKTNIWLESYCPQCDKYQKFI